MAKISFNALGAEVEYTLCDRGRSEELRMNGEIITDAWGDVGAWGDDYHRAIAGLHGAAKAAVEHKYLRGRAEQLIVSELFALRQMVRDLQEG